MQISTLIGKRVLSPDGDELGYVLNVSLTKNRAKLLSLVCVDENEDEYSLPARAVLFEGDALVCDKIQSIVPEGNPNPVGMYAYTDCGQSLGAVCDVAFEPEGAFLSFTEHKTPVPVSRIKFGQVVIVRSEKKAPAKKQSKERARQNKQEETKPSPAPQIKKSAETNVFDRINLLGRSVKRTVYGQDGVPVALTGERITPEILSRARRQNRLLQLTVNTLTNL